MAIDIPSEVALFLNICGIPYPDINEDDVRALAGHVRTFAAQVQDTHDSATGVIDQMGAFYSGESYQQLVATWAKMSATNMRQLESACELVGQALEVAATVITAVKVAVLAELAALAAAYTSIMLTPPLAPSAPLVAAAARRLCEQMVQYLVGYIVAEVIGKAIEPLEQAIGDMVNGLVYDAARDALDVPPSNGTKALHIDPDEVQRFAKVLDDHADDIMQHAANFAENVSKLDFTTAPRIDEAAHPPVTGPTVPDAGLPIGPAVRPDEFAFRPNGNPEARFGPDLPVGSGSPAGNNTPDARDPVGANAIRAGEPPADRTGNTGGSPVGTAEQASQQAAAADRHSTSDPAAAKSPTPGAVANTPDAAAAERSAGIDTPRSVSAPAASEMGTTLAREAALTDSARPASDTAVRQPGSASDPAPSLEQLPVEASIAGSPSSVAPLAQQGAGMAATPWGRTGQQAAATPNPQPLKAERPAAIAPKVRRPAATPWAKARRTREVPAAVHAPAAGRPPVHVIREKDAKEGGAENTGLADAKVAPSGVTAPPSDRTDPPGARG
ncbi:WXG100 family type VII secretion target [Nocardia barduliensis]|uniref:WXG100 family type VII secretion target n=1 Tax=Nocardia barduliensis TaxID=2736643 RepID=UPI00157423CF|nr:WXG100 family type VII secretion target [Nocardia barduliensis]